MRRYKPLDHDDVSLAANRHRLVQKGGKHRPSTLFRPSYKQGACAERQRSGEVRWTGGSSLPTDFTFTGQRAGSCGTVFISAHAVPRARPLRLCHQRRGQVVRAVDKRNVDEGRVRVAGEVQP